MSPRPRMEFDAPWAFFLLPFSVRRQSAAVNFRASFGTIGS
jgi:hypothetical protein